MNWISRLVIKWVGWSYFKIWIGLNLLLSISHQVTVIDTSDPDWWKGKCLGRVGYFPSKYCAKLAAGEKPLQVTHNLQVSDGERGENMTLLRDQIVIQVRQIFLSCQIADNSSENWHDDRNQFLMVLFIEIWMIFSRHFKSHNFHLNCHPKFKAIFSPHKKKLEMSYICP